MRIAVLTSGGDAPGMNAAVRGVVRRALQLGAEVHVVLEGYEGLIRGAFEPATWTTVSRIQQQGGTILGTARSEAFRTEAGRRTAVQNLLSAGISNLVVVGGDGSLTGADRLREEWPSHVSNLVAAELVSEEGARTHPTMGLVGLVGSIDNDLVGTDRTIGCDTALHRIVAAIDTLTSTARSHQRSFVVEVMGRHCGFLALAAAVCTGADHVLLPERPHSDWSDRVVSALKRGKAMGRRKSIVIVAEGAVDGGGRPIHAGEVRDAIQGALDVQTRVTVLGHVQRGGTPSAYDRLQSTTLGVRAAEALITSEPSNTGVVLTTAGFDVVGRDLMTQVRKTRAVADQMTLDLEAVRAARGPEFSELIDGYLASHLDALSTPERNVLFLHVGAPAPGMNPALRAFCAFAEQRGLQPWVAQEGLRGLLDGKVQATSAQVWSGIDGLGATVLGTNRWRPVTAEDQDAVANALKPFAGVVLVGGFGALQAAEHFTVPVVVLPATISNNVPGTDQSIGCDTAMNAVCEAVDRLKQSAVGSRHRVFFVEVMGRRCGWLAEASGIATGAERIYTDERGLTLSNLESDVQALNEAMDAGRSVGIVLVADGMPEPYRAEALAGLYRQASDGRFDTRVCVLGHLQQGGAPSPADRLLAWRWMTVALDRLDQQAEAEVVGSIDGRTSVMPVRHALDAADVEARRPLLQRTLGGSTL